MVGSIHFYSKQWSISTWIICITYTYSWNGIRINGITSTWKFQQDHSITHLISQFNERLHHWWYNVMILSLHANHRVWNQRGIMDQWQWVSKVNERRLSKWGGFSEYLTGFEWLKVQFWVITKYAANTRTRSFGALVHRFVEVMG